MTESTDKQLPDDRQLDEYLKGDSSVSRQYRQLHGAEVPADLDRLVLRQAEDAVKHGASRSRPAWVRWTAPLAVAASAVLVVSIVMETGVRDETAVLHAPQPTMQTRERGLVEKDAEEAIDSAGAASEAAEMAIEERLVDRAPVSEVPAEPRQEIAPVAPPPVRLEMPAPPVMHSSEQVAAAAPPAPPAAEAQQATASTNDRPPPFVESRPPPPPVAAPAAPAIMPARSVSRAAEDAARVLGASSLEEEARKSAAADEAKREDEGSARRNAYAREVSADMPGPEYEYTDPEAWLRDIRELRKENKQDQADREWRRFRNAFPDYEVAETDSAREAKK